MNKKASLSLSINAIVILVLAITMLGLGLGFTKGMFSKLSSRLEVPEPDIPATPDTPIVLPRESIEVLKTKDFEFTVNYYNGYTTGMVLPTITCSGALKTSFETTGTVTTAPQEVSAGTYKPFKFLVTALNIAGKDICTLQFDIYTQTQGVTTKNWPADYDPASKGTDTKQIIINAK